MTSACTVPMSSSNVVPWAVAAHPVRTPWAERQGVAFIGHFAHAPNPDAARFLVREVMPRVWRAHPEVRCVLAGSAAGAAIGQLAGPRVEFLGQVPELGSVFERVRLTVAPLRFGAGVSGNVLESLAAGVPCVMSPVAAEGIAWMIEQPPDYTGHNVGMAELRDTHGIMPSRSQRAHHQNPAVVTRSHLRAPS